MSTFLKTPKEIEIMAEGGKRLAEVLRILEKEVAVGVTTLQLDRVAYQAIHKGGAKPAFLHYRPVGARRPYPYTLCASVNEIVVHGLPSDYALQNGDIIKLDLGLIYQGWYLDAAITVPVGTVSREAKKLIETTREALATGIAEMYLGNTLGDVGNAIEKFAKKQKASVAEGLVGHGIGRSLHEDPTVFNFGKRGDGEPLVEGMVLAVEPMLTAGDGATMTRKDDSFATRDGSLAAHFEHTVAITKDGPQILTK
jgi:methionyl aminopeptidase